MPTRNLLKRFDSRTSRDAAAPAPAPNPVDLRRVHTTGERDRDVKTANGVGAPSLTSGDTPVKGPGFFARFRSGKKGKRVPSPMDVDVLPLKPVGTMFDASLLDGRGPRGRYDSDITMPRAVHVDLRRFPSESTNGGDARATAKPAISVVDTFTPERRATVRRARFQPQPTDLRRVHSTGERDPHPFAVASGEGAGTGTGTVRFVGAHGPGRGRAGSSASTSMGRRGGGGLAALVETPEQKSNMRPLELRRVHTTGERDEDASGADSSKAVLAGSPLARFRSGNDDPSESDGRKRLLKGRWTDAAQPKSKTFLGISLWKSKPKASPLADAIPAHTRHISFEGRSRPILLPTSRTDPLVSGWTIPSRPSTLVVPPSQGNVSSQENATARRQFEGVASHYGPRPSGNVAFPQLASSSSSSLIKRATNTQTDPTPVGVSGTNAAESDADSFVLSQAGGKFRIASWATVDSSGELPVRPSSRSSVGTIHGTAAAATPPSVNAQTQSAQDDDADSFVLDDGPGKFRIASWATFDSSGELPVRPSSQASQASGSSAQVVSECEVESPTGTITSFLVGAPSTLEAESSTGASTIDVFPKRSAGTPNSRRLSGSTISLDSYYTRSRAGTVTSTSTSSSAAKTKRLAPSASSSFLHLDAADADSPSSTSGPGSDSGSPSNTSILTMGTSMSTSFGSSILSGDHEFAQVGVAHYRENVYFDTQPSGNGGAGAPATVLLVPPPRTSSL